ncbi:HAD family phosphatase [Aerococcaceae bacterium zg-B36]|uniref:Cof-type HAD-IIB family hydrolase n=1 Tax=Aerococcaceae bacterium zg-252 TaxID=2796928 RepID=UPI001BD90612|nr:HAD family phosphatase [Aerococcaceae bacterium zg-B36]
MKQHLIAIDLDGTTLNDQSQLSPATIQALRAVSEQGHLVCIVTGRPFRNSENIYNEIGIAAPIVNFNGALCHFPGKEKFIPSYHIPLSKEIAFDLIANQDALEIDLLCAEGRDRLFTTSMNLPDSPFYPVDLAMVDRLNRESLTYDPTAITIFSSEEKMSKIEQNITKHYGDEVYVRTWGGILPCLEVVNKQINKAYGVQRIAEFYRIPVDNILAFGDENNDIEMIQYAGLGVAMKNATEEVKAVANDVTRYTNDEDGLADYLTHYFNL